MITREMMTLARYGFLAALALWTGAGAASATHPDETLRTVPGTVRETPAAPLIPYSGRLTPDSDRVEERQDASRATLAPAPKDAGGADKGGMDKSGMENSGMDRMGMEEVDIARRQTAILPSRSSWEAGFDGLKTAFQLLDEIVIAAGFEVRGRPFAVFTQTDDAGFGFDAMLPVGAAEGEASKALQEAVAEYLEGADNPNEAARAIKLGTSPHGRAYRFVHRFAYEDIETAYEAITAYLDTRSIVVEDAFIEEYVSDLTTPVDEALEVYIYVQPAKAARRGGEPQAPAETAPPPQQGEGE